MTAFETTRKAYRESAWLDTARRGELIGDRSVYPTFHQVYGNDGMQVVEDVLVDDGVLQVVGHPDDGIIEWVWFQEDGTVTFTRAGWGGVAYALFDGLKHAFGEAGK